jgi:hypothetical protein
MKINNKNCVAVRFNILIAVSKNTVCLENIAIIFYNYSEFHSTDEN